MSSLQDALPEKHKHGSLLRAASGGHGVPILAPPPPPPLSPVLGPSTPTAPLAGSPVLSGGAGEQSESGEFKLEAPDSKGKSQKDGHDGGAEEDFGDFQVA